MPVRTSHWLIWHEKVRMVAKASRSDLPQSWSTPWGARCPLHWRGIRAARGLPTKGQYVPRPCVTVLSCVLDRQLLGLGLVPCGKSLPPAEPGMRTLLGDGNPREGNDA